MPPRLHLGRLSLGKVDPLRAEVEVDITVDSPTPGYQLRCRLVGPHCAFANTVEVGYTLREKKRTVLDGRPNRADERVVFQAALPEPNYWDPQCPFLYHCFAELWQGAERQGQADFWYGLRRIHLGPQGLLVNNQPVALRGRQQSNFKEDKAGDWRQQGLNLIVAPVAGLTPEAWGISSRLGFCVLGRIQNLDAERRQFFERLYHPGALGWIVPAPDATDDVNFTFVREFANSTNQLLGVETDRPLASNVLEGYDFILCPAEALPDLAGVGLPKMVLVDELPDSQIQAAALGQRVIAWIQR
jgi:hypothetical protein